MTKINSHAGLIGYINVNKRDLTMNYERAIALKDSKVLLLEKHDEHYTNVLRIYYSVGIDDVEITETKGYTQTAKCCLDIKETM